ncbi:hypothetical protein A1O3_01040 [Capronia epimyces CBS 606.96]|uniref:Uncharacterized protein n=1 Tax=Capronia epimyces CBS 606.96 TaxID=1182542 RepID=W9YIY3_9EURO|nr:uncharacterized protein A1O3_01040 [Capronia epimyces CBS 606.96]EXJ92488.1 hypothetical protein A1O3_01040 [Capronia epimyces CBS 606.96]
MSSDTSGQIRSMNSIRAPVTPGNVSEAFWADDFRVSFIDIAALAITLGLMGTFVAILVYAVRKRCDGRRNACDACHTRQRSNLSHRDDDLEDVGLVFDEKDVVGKQD